jgi:hypothetical protein
VTGTRKKTDDDRAEIARIEYRGGLYETTDGLVGWPTQNVWRCLYDAATKFKLGTTVKRALVFDDVTVPMLLDGETAKADTLLDERPETLDYRSVVVQRARTMRARPKLTGWSCEHTFELLEDELQVQNLIPVFERAGRLVGIGDWRPVYGTFKLEVMS